MMPRALPVVFTRSAERQVAAADAWWRENRQNEAITDELQRAVGLLAAHPGLGAPARSKRLAGVRRLLLTHISYFVYYRPVPARRRIEILAFWHTSRGSEPPLSQK